MIRDGKTDRHGPRKVTETGFLTSLFEASWWALAWRGLLGLGLGITVLALPGMAFEVSLAVIGGYLVLDGVFTLITAFRMARREHSFWPYVVEGALSIAVGALALSFPGPIALVVLSLIALRSIVLGGIEIAAGRRLGRETGERDWLLWLAGLASIAFGIGLILAPGFGIPVLREIVSLYVLVFGAALVGEAFRLRSMAYHDLHPV